MAERKIVKTSDLKKQIIKKVLQLVVNQRLI